MIKKIADTNAKNIKKLERLKNTKDKGIKKSY